MLSRALVVSGVLSVAAILGLMALVLNGTEDSRVDTGSTASIEAVEEALPDPDARGVIILSQEGQLRGYTPDGEAASELLYPPYTSGFSPDGAWQALHHCTDAETCNLVIVAAGATVAAEDLETNAVDLGASFSGGEWSLSGSTFAALDADERLHLVEPFSREARLVRECCVTAFAWTARDELLITGEDAAGTSRLTRMALDGETTELASLTAPIERFYVSPDAMQFAFAQLQNGSFGLITVDAASGHLTDYGVLHGLAGLEGPQFAIAWSRDQRFVAVGPVAAPYSLYVLDTSDGVVAARHEFEEGYAGELVWSPSANVLAVSTYSPDRSRHEVYVVDARAGETPRHLLGGCRIVWSPDGQFLAVKAEPHTLGAEAINVASGHHWQLAGLPGMTPVAWGEDEAAALLQMRVTDRSAAVLGK